MNAEAEIYEKGNPWQRKVYRHMANYLEGKGITEFGKSAVIKGKGGKKYKHLLTEEQSVHNFITEEIHQAAIERFDHHKAGDRLRVLTNTAASQPYCFNLVIYLNQHLYLADQLFSKLMGKPVKVKHIEPEFTPNHCDVGGFERTGDESIGDQNGKMGTDADIAVFYTFDVDKKGLLLIEFKFIETEFSVCSTHKNNKDIRPSCYVDYYKKLIAPSENSASKYPSCGYKKYKNWELTFNSKLFDSEFLKEEWNCPFWNGTNQLWRNMLLAERVAEARQCDEFGFWVFSPKENDRFLWKRNIIEKNFRKTLTEKGNEVFRKVYLESIYLIFEGIITKKEDKDWIRKIILRYII